MAWLNNFKLGRAGYESVFALNPAAMNYEPRSITDFGRGLDGSGIDITLSPNRPAIQIDGGYINPAQQNQFLSLLHVTYEPLVFEPTDYDANQVFEVWQERLVASNTTQLPIPESSFTRAARAKQLNGSTAVIRPVGLWAAMAPTHGRTGLGGNLITPGLWGEILIEDFNVLPTGLLTGAGKNWQVTGGNGTTRDFFVTTTTPIEGAKDLIATTDGTGVAITASRANGGFWRPSSLFVQSGFTAEFHVAEWQMQVVDNTAGTEAHVRADGGAQPAWELIIVVTSPTTATYEWYHNGVSVAGPAALTTPFGVHTYKAVITTTTATLYVDATPVFNDTIATPVFNTIKLVCDPAVGAPSGTVVRWDVFDINDGDGYDPSTGLFNLIVSAPLTAGRPYFVTYAYNAIAVHMDAIPLRVEGGWVDIWKYNFRLEGM